MNLVKTSYNAQDVIVLLKDLTDEMTEMSASEREAAIQSGIHYSEMLPEEIPPSKEYKDLYNKALTTKADEIAEDIGSIAEIIYKKTSTPVIISLARAGIPVGILIKRYLNFKYNISCPHYAISIIRDKGIDVNAMEYIRRKEGNVKDFIFVDGWTGKGAIKTQLTEAVLELKKEEKWKDLSDDLYVLADPANITSFTGTHLDFLLPSACLNSTVSGLISRTILNSKINVENGDFHGAVYFKKFEEIDCSNEFLDIVTKKFKSVSYNFSEIDGKNGMEIVNDICKVYNIKDYKKVKPGIGETTRVLLRRIPWKILINKNIDFNDPDIQHILVLAKEKNVTVEKFELGNYKICGIIKELSDV
jgi:hypothetical protein